LIGEAGDVSKMNQNYKQFVTAKNKIIRNDRNTFQMTVVEKAILCKEIKQILVKTEKKSMICF
jgi:hypothetical protein